MPSEKEPFFIVGSPRSGTTILRDVLRLHSDLECPEETFFYRWDNAMGTKQYNHTCLKNKVLQKHRELDGIREKDFNRLYWNSAHRSDLQKKYAKAYLDKIGNPEARWFDKTPQNTNHLLLLLADFPDSKIVHIHRNPLDVMASLIQGRQFEPFMPKGAFNTWREAVQSASMLHKLCPERIYSLGLESLAKNPDLAMTKLSDFLNQDWEVKIPQGMVSTPPSRYEGLDRSHIEFACRHGSELMKEFGYSREPEKYFSRLPKAQTGWLASK